MRDLDRGKRSRTAKSTASSAMTRYVVSLPPAIALRPGATSMTACSRDTFVLSSAPSTGWSSGRRPANVPMTSALVSVVSRTSFA